MDSGQAKYAQSDQSVRTDQASTATYSTQDPRSASLSSSTTPQSDYGVVATQPAPSSSRLAGDALRYCPYPPPAHPQGALGAMAQQPSPSMSLSDASKENHPPANSASNADVPIDPSISQASPTYPPYSPYPQDQGMHQGYQPQHPGYIPPRPPHEQWPGYPPHQGMPPYQHPGGVQGPPQTSGQRPGQVYSFVPIPGAQQHKRPRRRYEEIERMYKCGWNGCEKAYGTLNHLNAHVTMQSHGTKRTPEEFKEIRKEWKARKKEEEAARKADEERQRQAAQQAQQVDGQPPQHDQNPAYQQNGTRPSLPPIGYQQADGHPQGQYAQQPNAIVYPQQNGQMPAAYGNYPNSPALGYCQARKAGVDAAPAYTLWLNPGGLERPLALGPASGGREGKTRKQSSSTVYVETLRELAKSGAKYPESSRRNKARERPTDLRNRKAIENNQKHLAVDPETYALQQAAAKEVEWINDPLRLSNRVLTLLRDDGPTDPYAFNRALELVRASEKRSIVSGRPQGAINNVVSWNHLMDWCMENKRPREAVKVFNEMKKRGHKPDAHSYTIMLRGFAANTDKPNCTTGAMTIYQSIRAANSDVKQNSTHLNAAANVFARAGDMDSLWLILGQARDRGPGSPDSVTYTIVLNALQKDLIKKTAQVLVKDEDASVVKIFDTAVEDGRKVWLDVVRKWQDAEISVDEPLVCAMGRLLLMSKKAKDVMDVFRLVQQTMKISIPSAPVVGPRDNEKNANEQADSADQEALFVFEQRPGERDQGRLPTTVEGPAKALFATPGNNTLSMLIEAATVAKKVHWGKAYWELLTDADGAYAITPDSQNVVAYLRLLRVSRSSKAVVQVLQRDWPAHVRQRLYTRGNFVIAMSTCVRDKNNPSVFENASGIAFAGEALDADPKVMTMYLNLAMWTTRGINSRLSLQKQDDGDLNFERDANKNNTFRALRRLEGMSSNVLRMFKARLAELEVQSRSPRERIGLKKKAGTSWFVDYTRTQERLEDLVGLLRAMVGAYDRILVVDSKLQERGNGPLDGAWLAEVRLNKAKFNAWLSKIDAKTKKDMGLTKAGLKSEYDPAARDSDGDDDLSSSSLSSSSLPPPDLSYGRVDQEGRLVEQDEVIDESHALGLARTPGAAKLHNAVSKQVKMIKTQRQNAKDWLSRRQRQEKEKVRRQDRATRLYPDAKRRNAHSDRGVRQANFEQEQRHRPGWGGGYDRMAERMGLEETSGMVDVHRGF
ncbi:hypothetical protein DV737_g1671, partial [Chaetothyriales sp. CBS 132003]